MIELCHKDLAYSLEEREQFLTDMTYNDDHFVLLNTCNRVELYSGDGKAPKEIVSHLFRVTSGVESAITGETSIQGQVKQAYLKSIDNKHISKGLNRLFQHALRVGKLVRSQTDISSGAISHGQIILEILAHQKVDIANCNILIIGVNNLNEKVIRALSRKPKNTLFVANRTYQKAQTIAKKYDCTVTSFDSLSDILPTIDIIISATSAPHLILKENQFQHTHNMMIFDMACPRDIDPKISIHSNITLYNLEDIEKCIDLNHHVRKQDLANAVQLIENEVDNYVKKHDSN